MFVVAEILAVRSDQRVRADIPLMKTKWLPTLNSAGIGIPGEMWLFVLADPIVPLEHGAVGLGLVLNAG